MILVTGGTHGIGRACVERLARDGQHVLFVGRDRDAGEALQRSVANTTYFGCDVAVESDCRRAVDEALKLGNGRLDGLVNNAGMSTRSDFAESTAAEWDRSGLFLAVCNTYGFTLGPQCGKLVADALTGNLARG